MATNYLLSTDDLKKKGLIHQNTDTKLLAVAIKRVQDRRIQPTLGSPLYRALLTRVENNDWNANYRELMDDYVVPAMVALVDAKIVSIGSNKITNKGTGRVQDENLQPNIKGENKLFQDELESDAEFYLTRLIGFLMDDAGTKYPEYTEGITRSHHDLKRDKKSYFIPWLTTTQPSKPYLDSKDRCDDEYGDCK